MGCGASQRTAKVADKTDACEDLGGILPAPACGHQNEVHETEPDPGSPRLLQLGGLSNMIRRPSHASAHSPGNNYYAKADGVDMEHQEEDLAQADEDDANKRDWQADLYDGNEAQSKTILSAPRTTSKASNVSSRSQGSLQTPKDRAMQEERDGHKKVARPESLSPVPGTQSEHITAGAESQDGIAELLEKAVLHSGSLVQDTMRVRALQACETLAEAHQGLPKADEHMPNFDMKVDPANLLLQLPHDIFKPQCLSLQRVSFMGTKWIALRLCMNSRAQCLKFCICAAALNNIGKNTSRSVVVEACSPSSSQEESIPGFVCAPIPSRERTGVSWLDVWPDISELADIIINDLCLPEKKVQAELKKWALHCDKKLRGGTTLRWNLWQRSKSDATPHSRSCQRAQSDTYLSVPGSYAVNAPERTRNRRSSSEPDITQINQACEMVRIEEEPKGGFSAMARWVRDRFPLPGVFGSLEDQMASLTPPAATPARGREPSPRGRDGRSRSHSGSSSRSGSFSKKRRPSVDGRERSGSQGSIHSASSGDRVSDRHLQRSEDLSTLAEAEAESEDAQADSDSHGPSKDAVRRRKSTFSAMVAVMPVVPEADMREDGDEEAEGEPRKNLSFRRLSPADK